MQNFKLSHHRKILCSEIRDFKAAHMSHRLGPPVAGTGLGSNLANVLSATQSCLRSGETEERAELWGLEEGVGALLFQQVFKKPQLSLSFLQSMKLLIITS